MTLRLYSFRRPILALALYGMGVLALAALPPSGGATMARANEPAFIMGTTTKVISGNTIAVGGVTLRVEGIYTPVPGEIYGHTAKVYTERAVRGLNLRCELLEDETMGALPVGRCISDGRELGAIIVEAGAARDCPRYSSGRFAELESANARELIQLPPECF